MIEFMGELRGLSRAEAQAARGGAWLERLGLGEWTKNKVQDLSKGMQQKVQFATALIHEPELVILDEPWSGLDPINAEVLREVVDEIRAAGRTVLFSTHQMEQAEKVCDAVCIIARGKKVLDGKLARHQARRRPAEGVDRARASPTTPRGRRPQAALARSRRSSPSERPPRPGEHADCEVELADGVDAAAAARRAGRRGRRAAPVRGRRADAAPDLRRQGRRRGRGRRAPARTRPHERAARHAGDRAARVARAGASRSGSS